MTMELSDGLVTASRTEMVGRRVAPFGVDFFFAEFAGIELLDMSSIQRIRVIFDTASAQDFLLDEIVPCIRSGSFGAEATSRRWVAR